MRNRYTFAPTLLLVLATALLCAAQTPRDLRDEEILKSIYSDPKVPAGFYTELPDWNDKVTVSVSWVRRQSDPNSPYFPIHAENAGEARKLTQEFLDKANVPADAKKILRQESTLRFFQFETEHLIRDHTYVMRLRVWRTAFYEPKPVTFNGSPLLTQVGKPQEAIVGVLRAMPLDKQQVRQFAEVLWWEENRDSVGVNVLRAPTVKEQGDLMIVSFPVAMKVGGDFGIRDVIHAFNSEFIINKKTGEVTRRVEKVREIAGRLQGR